MQRFNAGWYVMYTRPNQEHKVQQVLSEKRLGVYLPTVEKVRQWHDRRKVIRAPLFPSYVFVKLTQLKDFHESVNDNPGFLYFVKDGPKNALIKEEVINNIRFVMDCGREVESTTGYFTPDFETVIRDGPFTGLKCQVIEHKSRLKVLVRLNMLNRNLLATIPVEYLR